MGNSLVFKILYTNNGTNIYFVGILTQKKCTWDSLRKETWLLSFPGDVALCHSILYSQKKLVCSSGHLWKYNIIHILTGVQFICSCVGTLMATKPANANVLP